MFGSNNPFGQPSSSPFGSQSVFGQTSSTATNPFAPKPFGSTNAFGSQPGGGLVFGGTSTNMFGQASSPLASQPAFGASSAPAFGSSMPSFGASSTPAFGSSTSSFGGSSVFGQKPAFGGFGSSPSQASPFGSTFQQTQSAFGSNLFGSSSQSAFGASSTPAFGATTTPAFGATTAPAFGATTTPSFGSTSTPAFGSTTPLFGGTGAGFGVSSTPSFGSSVTPAFGSSSPLFGSSATPAFGTSSTPVFGSSSTPAFGSSTTPSFGFGSTPSFSQSTSAFGSTPFGTTPSPFGAQSSPFGAPTATATFGSPGIGQTAFGGQQVGSRVAPFTTTPETDGTTGNQTSGKLDSISAMPVYKDKSFEELRWEDYQRGDKGGPNTSGQPAVVGMGFSAPTQANPFGSIGTSGQPAANPFSSATSSSLFGPKTPTFGSSGFGSSSAQVFSSPFSSSSQSPFGSTSTTPLFGAPSSAGFGLGSSPSIFGGATNPASSSAFGSSLTFGSTQSSPGMFQSSTPSIGQTPSIFGQPSTGFQQTTPTFGSNPFSTPSTMFGGNMFSTSTPSLLPPNNTAGFGQATSSLSTAFQMPATAQTSNVNPFSGFGQPQSGGFGSPSNIFNPGSFVQSGAAPSNMVVQPAPITNPFGTLPALPQMSIGRVGSAPSVQYGISSMPVAEMPSPVRISSLLTPRHLSQRRIRLPARKYHPKSDGQRVPFFADDEAVATTPKADALFIPRENPRALIIRPIEQWGSRNTVEKDFILKETHPNGQVSEQPSAPPAFGETLVAESPPENGHKDVNAPPPPPQKANGVNRGADSSFITISGHRVGEAAIAYEHGADIEALMPKLRRTDYYTEPRIQELAAKERADPGFCRRVKDFVVGRHGFGSIKFYGETDVRRLDLESIVQFYNREVTVYNDESKKPPVGQGLNKAAEVTLLNIKCTNKKTGEQYTEGPRVDKYKEMLMKKDEEQGTEFLSYDPLNGEWKFLVKHFSRYGL